MSQDIDFNFYYVVKGIVKAIPVIGAIIEESVFEQYDEELKQRFSSGYANLNAEDRLLLTQVSKELCTHEHILEFIVKASLGSYETQIKNKLSEFESKILNNLGEMDEELDTIKGIVRTIHNHLENKAELEKVLANIETKRLAAIRGLSRTQQHVLHSIPDTPTLVAKVLAKIRADVSSLAEVRDKELHLRLHELRYLGLIDRSKQASDDWVYWRSAASEVVIFQ